MGARRGLGFPRADSHLSFRSSAMADQVGIWGGCPRRLEVLASDEVDLDLHTAATKLWVIGVGIGVDRLAKNTTMVFGL